MGLFDNNKTHEEKVIEKAALKELESYKKDNYLKFRQIIPLYGITIMTKSEENFFKKIIADLKIDIKNGELTSEEIYDRIILILTAKYGEQISEEEANELLNEEKRRPLRETEIFLEEKFGFPFQDRAWFKCTIEEMRYSTFSNTNTRDVDTAYVVLEDTYLTIAKESVFLKTNMGYRKVYYQNIAGIDYDSRGIFHLSNSLIINLKSFEHIQLKNVPENYVQYVVDMFEQYMSGENEVIVDSTENNNSNVDDLMKYAELLEKGLITREEFDLKKTEIMGTTNEKQSSENIQKFCGNCGSKIDSNSNFCSNCGNPIIK